MISNFVTSWNAGVSSWKDILISQEIKIVTSWNLDLGYSN